MSKITPIAVDNPALYNQYMPKPSPAMSLEEGKTIKAGDLVTYGNANGLNPPILGTVVNVSENGNTATIQVSNPTVWKAVQAGILPASMFLETMGVDYHQIVNEIAEEKAQKAQKEEQDDEIDDDETDFKWLH